MDNLCAKPSEPVNRTYLARERVAVDHGDTILDAGIQYGIIRFMGTARKITVEVPQELLKKAQQASGAGVTETVRTGLRLVAASRTYARLRQLRGKVRFTRTLAELKADR